MDVFDKYEKKKEFLICIDSDGCAMDTMDIKHIQCFGPCMVKEWNLSPWEKHILHRWNEVNLYTMTRGINRFIGLAMVLEEVNNRDCLIKGIEEFVAWSRTSSELSENGLKDLIKNNRNPMFQKALSWSQGVNRSIENLNPEDLKPFKGVLQGIKQGYQNADIAIVSSANEAAVREEWERYGLMDFVDICLTQQVGSKAYCIKKMLEKGYNANQVLMVGDAPGDKLAAEINGVLYYPILVKHESYSWQQFIDYGLPGFLQGNYDEAYQKQMNQEFEENLT